MAASRTRRTVTASRSRRSRAEAETRGTKRTVTKSVTRKAAVQAERNGRTRTGEAGKTRQTGSNNPRQVTAARGRFGLTLKSLGRAAAPARGRSAAKVFALWKTPSLIYQAAKGYRRDAFTDAIHGRVWLHWRGLV
jgi:hypothetical protein